MENNIIDIIKKAKALILQLKKDIKNANNLKDIDLVKVEYTGKKGSFTFTKVPR